MLLTLKALNKYKIDKKKNNAKLVCERTIVEIWIWRDVNPGLRKSNSHHFHRFPAHFVEFPNLQLYTHLKEIGPALLINTINF